jgi:TPR repeat protein
MSTVWQTLLEAGAYWTPGAASAVAAGVLGNSAYSKVNSLWRRLSASAGSIDDIAALVHRLSSYDEISEAAIANWLNDMGTWIGLGQGAAEVFGGGSDTPPRELIDGLAKHCPGATEGQLEDTAAWAITTVSALADPGTQLLLGAAALSANKSSETADQFRLALANVERLTAELAETRARLTEHISERTTWAAQRIDHAVDLQDLLIAEPCAARDLDLKILGLDSWLADGAVPTYVPRIVDADLDSRLIAATTTSSPGAAVGVVGAPKSGKTRSLLEAIMRVAPRATLYIPRSSAPALARLAEYLAQDAPARNTHLILLDDLHLLCAQPTFPPISRIIATLVQVGCIVAYTIHDSFLAQAQVRMRDHRREAGDPETVLIDADLVTLVERSTIVLASTLEKREFEQIGPEVRSAADAAGVRLDRLAEAFAAIDVLRARCDQARTDHRRPARLALLGAALDSYYIEGATDRRSLRALTQWQFERLSPGRLWEAEMFEDALRWATEGVGGIGSSHAIIQVEGQRSFRLTDGLVASVGGDSWDPGHLEGHVDDLSEDAILRCGRWSYLKGLGDLGEWWFRRAAQRGNAMGSIFAGTSAFEDGRYDEAISLWTGPATDGITLAMFDMGCALQALGRLDEAKIWFERAGRDWAVAAMARGQLALAEDDRDLARYWYAVGASNGEPIAVFNLAQLMRDEDPVVSLTLFEVAAGGGVPQAQTEVAIRVASEEPIRSRSLLEQAADAGDPRAIRELGLRLFHEGSEMLARDLWSRNGDAGDAESLDLLGVVSHQRGDRDTARVYFERAAEMGSRDAVYHLGALELEAGVDVELADEFFLRAALAGHPIAMHNVGHRFFEKGDWVQARKWWRLAADEGEPASMQSLGTLAARAGDLRDAREWWERAAECDYVMAARSLVELCQALGDYEASERWRERAAELDARQ